MAREVRSAWPCSRRTPPCRSSSTGWGWRSSGEEGGERGAVALGPRGLLVAVAVNQDFGVPGPWEWCARVSGGVADRRGSGGAPRGQKLVREKRVPGDQAGVVPGRGGGPRPQGEHAGGLEAHDGDAPADERTRASRVRRTCARAWSRRPAEIQVRPQQRGRWGRVGPLRRPDRSRGGVARAGRPSDVRVKYLVNVSTKRATGPSAGVPPSSNPTCGQIHGESVTESVTAAEHPSPPPPAPHPETAARATPAAPSPPRSRATARRPTAAPGSGSAG